MTPSELQSVLERRAERAALAASSARRNLPTSLLALSCLLLVVALAALAWSWSSRGDAVNLLNARVSQAQSILDRSGKITAIRNAQRQLIDTRRNEPLAGGPLKLQQACPSERLRAHLASQAPASDQVSSVEAGVALRRLRYNNLQHDSIADIMGWIENARREIQGLEIERFTLRPGPNTWTFSITFMRYEKKEG